MYNRPLHHELFLELLRSALWDKVPNISLFRNLDDTIWEKVMATAQKQALLGVCYTVLNLLPSDCRPSKSKYLIWAAKANYIRQDNRKKINILSELLTLFEKHDIHPVVMKGFSSAIFYPEPELRICGDIDLFIPDKHKESVKLIESLGFETSFTHKHHKFYYEGVLIELHHDIISPPFKEISQYSVHEVEYFGVKFKVFDENTTSILLLTHFINHMIGPGVGFRHFSDWILFFQKNHNKIDKICFNNYIKENKLISFVDTFKGFFTRLKTDDNIINIKTNSKDIDTFERDLFIQGDCGFEEQFSRKSKSNLYVYFRVIIRFLCFFRYGTYITINMLLYRLLGK